MANVFQLAVLYFCLAVIAAIVVACAFWGLKRVVEILRSTLPSATLAVFLGATGVVTVIAQKRGGDEAAGTPSRSFGEAALLPLPGAVTNEKWRAHGAYQNWMHIPATNWWARSPSGGWLDRITAFAWCEFRPDLFTTNAWPRPFPERLSLAAEANWPVVPVNGQDARSPSLFWHGASPSNTLVMTWLGGLYAQSHTNQVDFQAELFNDGSVGYRYADRTERYAATLPFDLDGDGLENSVDPDPIPPGSDAHGTSAEWYNTVCSNVFSAVATSCDPPGSGAGGAQLVAPVELTWREGVNSNAYYFVDVVAERGPAPIYFTGDRDSRLGNPVIVALAGVTNRVPLLVGIDYSVTSDTPFTVSFPVDYMYPEVQTNVPCAANVRWPLNFVFTESIGASNRLYTVTVEPYDPGGVLEWNNSGGGIPMRGESSNEGCACVHYGFYSCWFTCSDTCTCSMGCTAEGCYHLEDASFLVSGGQCRCGFDDPPPDSPPSSHEPDDPPSLTITFSKSAVIFEDTYESRPGKMEPRRSTRARLTIDAYGGAQGGALWLTESNVGKLTAVSGGVSLPYSQNLTAGESYHATGVYEGVVESGSAEDIRVIGTFTPNGGAQSLAADDRLTAVRILLKPVVHPPKDGTLGRHEYGVCELVEHHQFPAAPVVTWNPVGGGSNTVSNSGQPCFQFPLDGCENPLRVELGDVSYVPRLDCIEPSGIVSGKVELCTYGLPPGKAGGIGLWQEFRVTPLTVSFSRIAVEEVPCDQGTHEGYFTYGVVTSRWTHTREAGAGKWFNVDIHNRVGGDDDVHDEACLGEELLPMTAEGILTNDYSVGWIDGSMVWQVPFGWHVRGTEGEAEPFKTFGTITHEFYIDRWGRSGVCKFGNQATRLLNDRRFLNVTEMFNNMVITNSPTGR